MQENEMEIIRAVSVKLDENTLFVLTYQYHTEKDKDAIPLEDHKAPNDRSKSRYRMLGRILTAGELEKEAGELRTDANRLGEWKWPRDPSWNGRILYSKDSTNRAAADWLRMKLKKAVSWETYLKILDGFKRDVRCDKAKYRKRPQDMYTVLSPNARYEKTGYQVEGGGEIDITDREALLKAAGKNIWKEIQMKLAGRPKGC